MSEPENVGLLRLLLSASRGRTLNELLEVVLGRATWRDVGTPLLGFVLEDVTGFEDFMSKVGPAWDAAGRPDPAVLFPASMVVGDREHRGITTPSMHLFVITQGASKPLRLACASDCQKTLMRLLGANRGIISALPVSCASPRATLQHHAHHPHTEPPCPTVAAPPEPTASSPSSSRVNPPEPRP